MDDRRHATSGSEEQVSQARPHGDDAPVFFEPLLAGLAKTDEPERYRLIAALLGELAEQVRSGTDGYGPANADKSLAKKLQLLGEQKATLNDTLAATSAELAHRETQLKAEQTRAEELQRIVDDQRARLETSQREQADIEAQTVAKNAELHRIRVDHEALALKLQRAERDASGQDRIDSLERDLRERTAEIAELRERMDRLRTDKDAKLERLADQLRQSESGAAQGADELLAAIWQRFASAKPSLAEGHIQPAPQAAERLADAFIELVRFADDFDKAMRVFLGEYTKHHPSVKVPWDVYAKRDDVYQSVRKTIAPQGGKPVGLLKMRLRFLYSWSQAAMIGCDSAVESLASELQAHLMGPAGAGSDPNRKIKEYVRDDGHYLFLQHIRELRSQKLAESYGRGG